MPSLPLKARIENSIGNHRKIWGRGGRKAPKGSGADNCPAKERSQHMSSTKRAVCPNNEEHGRFVTTAHVSQDWYVDHAGNYMGCLETLAVKGPSFENAWHCATCGAEAAIV